MNCFRFRIILRFLFLLISMTLPALVAAATEEFEMTLPARPEMIINLRHSFGDLDVRHGSDNQVRIIGSKMAESGNPDTAQNFLDQIELSVVNGTNQLNITTVYPNIGFSLFRRNKVVNRGMSYLIEIPKGTILKAELRFGNINLNSLRGDFNVQARQAVIQAYDLEGDVAISNVGGSITVESVKGDMVIGSDQGVVSIADTSGNLELVNKFGSTEIKNVQGSVLTKGEITPINVEDIGGAVEIHTYASVVSISNVAGDVRVKAREAEVIVADIQADAMIENREGEITVERSAGDLNIVSVLGPVTIRHANENIIVHGQSSDLIVEQVYLDTTEHPRLIDLTTSLGFITLELPTELSATLKARTVRRPINANFPVYLHDSSDQQLEVSAEFGDRKDSIVLTGTENVEITLTKL